MEKLAEGIVSEKDGLHGSHQKTELSWKKKKKSELEAIWIEMTQTETTPRPRPNPRSIEQYHMV